MGFQSGLMRANVPALASGRPSDRQIRWKSGKIDAGATNIHVSEPSGPSRRTKSYVTPIARLGFCAAAGRRSRLQRMPPVIR